MGSILVLYHSQQYGNTQLMAEAVAEGAEKAGAEVELVNTNEHRLDIEVYRKVEGVAFGSPDYFSYIAGGLKVFLDDWYIVKQKDPTGLEGKRYALFYSHGGGGKVRESMESLFESMGEKVGETVDSSGRPGDATLDGCRELGSQLGEAVKG